MVFDRIALQVKREKFHNLAKHGIDVVGVRLNCFVNFKVGDHYTEPQVGIIDTGAEISIIPQRIWSNLPFKRIAENKLWGLSTHPESFERSIFGEVICRLQDEQNHTSDFSLRADLVYNDDIPLVLGFLDLIELGALHIHLSANENYLEFR